ncbi:response regulator transcription factor [Puteibacter caeruleilacunae]|nr:response regulator transcription factor [Puteibacter caeruleilacunae]
MKNQPIKLLLVEDDPNLGLLLEDFLSSNDFNVKLFQDGQSALDAFACDSFDFCILDIMLPDIDGFTIAKSIKAEDPKMPIIFLTARSMKHDKITGFNLGVDDYITKPFDEDELLCRINAILNRIKLESIEEPKKMTFNIGAYLFDYANQQLSLNESSRRLTYKENEVLYMLCQNIDNITKRDDILNKIWGESDYFTGRSLDVFIAKLRKYLANDPKVKIERIPKVGYILSD